MNFSNPTPIKKHQAHEGWIKVILKKAWALISLISGMVPGPTTRQNITSKNIGVLVFIVLILHLVGCGIWLNAQWIMKITIEGDWFYYTGIAVVVYSLIDSLHAEKRVREFAMEKKIMMPNQDSLLERAIGRSQLYNVFAMIAEALAFFWVVLGIFCYDTWLCVGLLGIMMALSAITEYACKTLSAARKIFMIESIFLAAAVLLIILNHFLTFQLSNLQTIQP